MEKHIFFYTASLGVGITIYSIYHEMDSNYTSFYSFLRKNAINRVYKKENFDIERYEELKIIIPNAQERINHLKEQKIKGQLLQNNF